MKTKRVLPNGFHGLLRRIIGWSVCLLFCASVAQAATLTSAVLDGGGQRTTSATYTMDGHIGGLSGISNVDDLVARAGYVGQLTDIVALELAGEPENVEEEASTQLSGLAVNDDETMTVVAGSDVNWDAASFPLDSIDANGLATASIVYEDTSALFTGTYAGHSGTGSLMVLDTDPDNFGTYAGDGLPDDWQVLYFGIDNPDAAPDADPTETGQNNWFRYVAGLNPTNANEVFIFRIAATPDEEEQRDLIFEPVREGRIYTFHYSTDLVEGSWQEVTPLGVPVTNAQEVTTTDLAATESHKIYQLEIILP